jgi:hypothetical protein
MPGRLLTACLLSLLIGCGKPPATAPSAAASQTNAPATAATDEAQLAAVLGELTQAVRKFGVEQRRAPKTLEEVAAAGYLSRIPEAPSGKKFAISKELQVYLTNP